MKTADFAACVLICLHPEAEGGQNSSALPNVEEEQILAIARALQERGVAKLTLVCTKNSRLSVRAQELRLRTLEAHDLWLRKPFLLLRLWNAHRREKTLLIQTVGEQAVDFGYRMLRMRREGSALLAHAFFLRPPPLEVCRGNKLRFAHTIFCGSTYVRRYIEKAWETAARAEQRRRFFKRRPAPFDGNRLVLLQPGVALHAYAPAPQWKKGQHFIFGMASSLMPHSGVSVALRAMAAIWQRDDAPLWEVRMVGAGPRYAEILEEATDLGVVSRLCLLNEQHLPDILKSCHGWLALGARFDEPPETLWAGFAAHLPVICTQSALHLERLLGHEEAAILLENDNPQVLAHAMLHIMLDTEHRLDYARRGDILRDGIGYDRMSAEACRIYTVLFHRHIKKM